VRLHEVELKGDPHRLGQDQSAIPFAASSTPSPTPGTAPPSAVCRSGPVCSARRRRQTLLQARRAEQGLSLTQLDRLVSIVSVGSFTLKERRADRGPKQAFRSEASLVWTDEHPAANSHAGHPGRLLWRFLGLVLRGSPRRTALIFDWAIP
jgi:hypothetical protein